MDRAELDPNNARAYYSKGCIFSNIGALNETFKYYNRAMELVPKAIRNYRNYN
jgi:hypothetical protein